jgi:Glycosyltransferase family 87
VRRFSALLACAGACALPAAASAAPGAISGALRPAPVGSIGSAIQPSVAVSAAIPPAGRAPAARDPHRQRPLSAEALQGERLLAIANALPKMRALRAEYPGAQAFLISPYGRAHREVLYFSPTGQKIGVVVIDSRSGRVLEQWTGFQLEWKMARGYPGYFGRHVDALYIWLPLCLLFMLPFLNLRRPFSLLHLDLLVLLSFSVSLAFFNHAHIYASVPLVYPPLLYLLARMLTLMRRGSRPEALRLLVPARWLALGVLLLIGFRVALNVTDSNVVDIGHAGVIGAQRIVQGKPLYGSYPVAHEHADTYGPVNYEAYVPFEQLLGASGTPAAQAAAIVFDLLAVALLFLLGRRVRGPTLGIALAYAWVSYPFTLFALESNTNDALVAVLVLAALLTATYRSQLARTTRGAFAALAGLAKFAPLALVPLLATHGLRELPPARRPRALALFVAGFLGAAALVSIPALSHASLHTIYDETIGFQANRGSPFSVWGLYGGLGGLQLTVQIAAVLLALALAVVPRRADLVGLAAACAAVVIAVQLGLGYWFYFYIPWFFPLAMLALLGRFSALAGPGAPECSTPARSSQPAAAADGSLHRAPSFGLGAHQQGS